MRDPLEQIKKKALPILKEAGVTRSSIFGSYVHGENTEDSDIDILIEFPRGNSFFDLAELQLQLEQALGKKVDILTYNSIHPLLKEIILNEQVRIL
ncbi:MAG: hypothetical protein EXR50_00745 [Dehalococcoidia bacterium]|nr:hypothetical protein [Dehalococcoidia bacterium]